MFATQSHTPPATRYLRNLIDIADNAIADALEERLRRLSIDSPTQPAPQYAEEGAEIHGSEPPVRGNENGNGVEEGAAAEGEESDGINATHSASRKVTFQ